MKRFLLITCIVALTACGCRTHREAVVNAQPEFSAEETWQLSEMRGKEVTLAEGQKKITLQVNPEAGTISGFSGCNRYFGNVKFDSRGHLTLSELNGTKMACPEAFHKVESAYMQMLRKCDGYSIEQYRLQLLQGDKVLLTFEKQ